MNIFRLLILLFMFCLGANAVAGEASKTTPFTVGSYQKILEAHANEPFVLVLWSVNCSACMKEMEVLRDLHQERKNLNIVMLSTDDVSERDDVVAVLRQKGIAELESWVFAESNSQLLRYEIDPTWYGEIPRTYFFDAQHQRRGISGKISKQEFVTLYR